MNIALTACIPAGAENCLGRITEESYHCVYVPPWRWSSAQRWMHATRAERSRSKHSAELTRNSSGSTNHTSTLWATCPWEPKHEDTGHSVFGGSLLQYSSEYCSVSGERNVTLNASGDFGTQRIESKMLVPTLYIRVISYGSAIGSEQGKNKCAQVGGRDEALLRMP